MTTIGVTGAIPNLGFAMHLTSGLKRTQKLEQHFIPTLMPLVVRIYVTKNNIFKLSDEFLNALRDTIKASHLMDARGHAVEVEAAFRKMWRKWCAGVTQQ